tara:strand:+ start:1507 stop:1905 length:399 start_codon:yes stop_codon:yes gene_type:complete
MNNNKIMALQNATNAKREKTFLKVKTVLKVMQTKSLPINFESVAKLSGVSKTWLYKELLIAAEIKRLRKKEGTINRMLDYKSMLDKKDDELIELKARNKVLNEQVRRLKDQLEVVHGELYRLKYQSKFKVIV